MDSEISKVILFSKSGYSEKNDSLLVDLIAKKILLFCAVGKDCETWHDIMDELYVGKGEERDFLMLTTWHNGETLEEVIDFAKSYDFEGIDNEKVQVFEV